MTTASSKVAIKPLEDRIVVQPLDAEQTTASGLVIPDTAKEKPQEGVVLAIGPGRFEDGKRVELDVKVGDVVLYSKYGGTRSSTTARSTSSSRPATSSRSSRSSRDVKGTPGPAPEHPDLVASTSARTLRPWPQHPTRSRAAQGRSDFI
ncbi:10 kDa chaperonin [Streptomyces sp. SudanB66_2053]